MELFKLYDFTSQQKKENIYYHVKQVPWNVKHKCTYWEFLVVKRGVILNGINNSIHAMFCNDVTLVRPDDLHTVLARGETPFEFVNLMIHDEYMKKLLDCVDCKTYDMFASAKSLSFSGSSETIYEIDTAIHKADKENDDDRQRILKPVILKLIALFMEKLCAKENDFDRNVIQRVIAVMQKKENIRLSVKELCQEVGYSQGYVTRCFHKQGMLPNDVFRKIKLNFACDLLESSELSVLEISQEVGLSGIHYFNKRFREQFGILPTEYRQERKKQQAS